MVIRTRQTFNDLLISYDFKQTFDDEVFYLNGNSEEKDVIQSKERGEIKPAGKYGQIVLAMAGLSSPMWRIQKSFIGETPKLADAVRKVIKEMQGDENRNDNGKVDVNCYSVLKNNNGIGYGLVSLCSNGSSSEFEQRLIERRLQVRNGQTDLADALKFAEKERYGYTILWLEQINITATYEQANEEAEGGKREEKLRVSFLMNR